MELDSVQIGAPDVAATTAAYRVLLGVEPVARAGGGWRFALARGAIEIEAGEPGIRSLRFIGAAAPVDDFLGLRILVDANAAPVAPAHTDVAVDHVVVTTPDPERAIALWRDRVGLRLAFDRVFEQRGLRLLFFRSGGMTLEYAAGHPPTVVSADGKDRFHGVSYRVTDLAARRERLLAAGVDVSEVRTGMKRGTIVATVRSGTGGVPTLLLQVVDG